MLGRSRKLLLGGFLSFFSDEEKEEDPYTITESIIDERIKEFEESMPASGWERVKFGLFHVNQYGERSPFVRNLWQCTMMAAAAGAFYGGAKQSQVAYLSYMRTNQATTHLTHLDAKKRLQDKIMVAYMKGAAELSWRTGLFTFLFMGASNAIALYRNKEGIVEYAVAGALAGASSRMHIGLRHAFVGSILGFGFGGAAGALCYTLLYLRGYSMVDVRRVQYEFSLHRSSQVKRMDDLGERQAESNPGDIVLQRLIQDEKANRIEDDLANI